uniref:Uncharacterized protein n=1 Tax=Romanomermis culicivorax TaxID=13658 RepID=A0A915HK10_ROMCU
MAQTNNGNLQMVHLTHDLLIAHMTFGSAQLAKGHMKKAHFYRLLWYHKPPQTVRSWQPQRLEVTPDSHTRSSREPLIYLPTIRQCLCSLMNVTDYEKGHSKKIVTT